MQNVHVSSLKSSQMSPHFVYLTRINLSGTFLLWVRHTTHPRFPLKYLVSSIHTTAKRKYIYFLFLFIIFIEIILILINATINLIHQYFSYPKSILYLLSIFFLLSVGLSSFSSCLLPFSSHSSLLGAFFQKKCGCLYRIQRKVENLSYLSLRQLLSTGNQIDIRNVQVQPVGCSWSACLGVFYF